MRNLLTSMLAAAILCGCASAGNNFDDTKVSQIKKGETTEPELIAMFGQPIARGVDSENGITLNWTYVSTQVKGETFIPFAGAFVGGANSSSKTLLVRLDKSGKVIDYNLNNSNMSSSGLTQPVPGHTNTPAYSPKAGASL